MNRPFYAFGVLLALLALAMYAVGSSSRSTTVQAQPAAPSGTLITPAARLGSIYIVVLPAAEETVQPDCKAKDFTELKPIQLTTAECDAAGITVILDAESSDARPALTPDESSCDNGSGEDWLALFHELAPRQPARPALWRLSATRLRAWLDLPTIRGIQNLALRGAQRLGCSAESKAVRLTMDWREYAELMDSIAANAAGYSTETGPEQVVRSSDWMLHFAVSSLSQLGLSLQRAAAELQRLQFGTCDRQGE